MTAIRKYHERLPQSCLDLMNELFLLEKKAKLIGEKNTLLRSIHKLKSIMENDLFKEPVLSAGLCYHDPTGEKYDESRTDCVASISGTDPDNLEIIEVVKPIIFNILIIDNQVFKTVVQKGVVVVKSKN